MYQFQFTFTNYMHVFCTFVTQIHYELFLQTFCCLYIYQMMEFEWNVGTQQYMYCGQGIQAEASILGGRGGGSRPPNENIGGANISFCPPIISTTWKIHNMYCKNRFKSIVRHYKTIKFYIKILLNIHNFQFFLLRKLDRHPWIQVEETKIVK